MFYSFVFYLAILNSQLLRGNIRIKKLSREAPEERKCTKALQLFLWKEILRHDTHKKRIIQRKYVCLEVHGENTQATLIGIFIVVIVVVSPKSCKSDNTTASSKVTLLTRH